MRDPADFYVGLMSVSAAISILSILVLVFQPLRGVLSFKLTLFAFIASILPLVVVILLVTQIDMVGVAGLFAGEFKCSNFHGLYPSCTLMGAVFDAVVITLFYSLVSFGLLPLSAFLLTLVVFAFLKIRLFRKGK